MLERQSEKLGHLFQGSLKVGWRVGGVPVVALPTMDSRG